MPPLLEGHIAPGLVTELAGFRSQAPPPEFLTGQRVVGNDDAGVRPPARIASSVPRSPYRWRRWDRMSGSPSSLGSRGPAVPAVPACLGKVHAST